MKNSKKTAFVYVVRCRDGSLYTGWTYDLTARLAAHAAGKGAKYTRSRLPVTPAACFEFSSSMQARRFEARFKRLRRAQKDALIDASDPALADPIENDA